MHRQTVEHGGIPVGIAVPQNGKLRFIAVKFHVIDLDNRLFGNIAELKRAISTHLIEAKPMAA